jgi:hypothetical protein
MTAGFTTLHLFQYLSAPSCPNWPGRSIPIYSRFLNISNREGVSWWVETAKTGLREIRNGDLARSTQNGLLLHEIDNCFGAGCLSSLRSNFGDVVGLSRFVSKAIDIPCMSPLGLARVARYVIARRTRTNGDPDVRNRVCSSCGAEMHHRASYVPRNLESSFHRCIRYRN